MPLVIGCIIAKPRANDSILAKGFRIHAKCNLLTSKHGNLQVLIHSDIAIFNQQSTTSIAGVSVLNFHLRAFADVPTIGIANITSVFFKAGIRQLRLCQRGSGKHS